MSERVGRAEFDTIVPRLLTRREAAAYCHLSTNDFNEHVKWGLLPKALGAPTLRPLRWDRHHIKHVQVEPHGVVYFIGFAGYVKIGFTKKPLPRRVAEIQTGSPERLTIYRFVRGSRDLETEFQNRFAMHHSHGEWYRRDGELAAFLASVDSVDG